MKCQILFSGKNKKNIINLSSAENAQRVVKVNIDHTPIKLPKYQTETFLYNKIYNISIFLWIWKKIKLKIIHIQQVTYEKIRVFQLEGPS